MEEPHRPTGLEAAGSLTPALEGAPCSAAHSRRMTKEKGRVYADGAGKKKTGLFLLEEEQTR